MAKPPAGKRALNTHISDEEHGFLQEMARRQRTTVTTYLRSLIRNEMFRVDAKATADESG